VGDLVVRKVQTRAPVAVAAGNARQGRDGR